MPPLLKVERLEVLAGLPPSGVEDRNEWLDSLSTDRAWQALGLFQPIADDLGGAGHDPQWSLRVLLDGMETEFARWLRRPEEVVEYFLACKAVLQRHEVAPNWHWTETHQAVWRDRCGHAPAQAPQGIRIIPLVVGSLRSLVSDHLDPPLPALFSLLVPRTSVADRMTARVPHLCKFLESTAEALLGNAIDAFQHLQTGHQDGAPAHEAWQTQALRSLQALSASLPEELHDREASYLAALRESVIEFRPTPLPMMPAPHWAWQNGPLGSENSHFHNNWD